MAFGAIQFETFVITRYVLLSGFLQPSLTQIHCSKSDTTIRTIEIFHFAFNTCFNYRCQKNLSPITKKISFPVITQIVIRSKVIVICMVVSEEKGKHQLISCVLLTKAG